MMRRCLATPLLFGAKRRNGHWKLFWTVQVRKRQFEIDASCNPARRQQGPSHAFYESLTAVERVSYRLEKGRSSFEFKLSFSNSNCPFHTVWKKASNCPFRTRTVRLFSNSTVLFIPFGKKATRGGPWKLVLDSSSSNEDPRVGPF